MPSLLVDAKLLCPVPLCKLLVGFSKDYSPGGYRHITSAVAQEGATESTGSIIFEGAV